MENKKDIILISAHCNTGEKLKTLERLLFSLDSLGKDVFLVSNTIIPDHLLKFTNFYLYDSINDVVLEKYLRFPVQFVLSDLMFTTRSIPWINSIYPILRMMFNGVRMCMLNGYRIVHYIEYDTEIINSKNIEDINQLLIGSDIGGIYYRDDISTLSGGSLIFDTSKYTLETFNFDKSKIENKFSSLYESCEMYCLNELMLPFNSVARPLPTLERDGMSINKSNAGRTGIRTGILFYNNSRVSYLFFVEFGSPGCNFKIVIDGSSNDVYVGDGRFYMNDVPDGSRNIEIYRDNLLIYSYDLENPDDLNAIKNQTEITKI